MQSVFVIITKLTASNNYFCKRVFFLIVLATMVILINPTVFSKRCFSDSSPWLATEEKPFRRTKNACKHQCFEAFWCLLPLQILTTLCTHHSEKHRLENTVCYSLVNSENEHMDVIIKKKGGNSVFSWEMHLVSGKVL